MFTADVVETTPFTFEVRILLEEERVLVVAGRMDDIEVVANTPFTVEESTSPDRERRLVAPMSA
ncbi:hypothetical protein SDC9_210059 [bioreactor metagenome]|uniref:Uncharacterized protein n=1 Tax=bioreactor metagenome TaxID=1076179 RepID=A0A645JGH1_9ZZZZ